MKNEKKITGILTIVKWDKLSYYGNPRAVVSINDKQYKTQVNAMLGYAISNYDNQVVRATVGTHYNTPSISDVELI